MRNRKRLLVLLGLVVSAVFLWIAFRDLRPGEVLDNIQHINIIWLIAGALVYFLAVTVIALRWQYLLRAVKFIPLRELIPLVAIGYMGNNVYPLRSGEALRIVLLQRNHGVPVVKATTTVIVERVFDGLVMLTFIVVPLLVINTTSNEVRTIASFTAPIFLSALAAFFILATQPNLLRRFVKLLPARISELVRGIAEDIISGLEGLRTPGDLAGAVISSYSTWAIEAGVYWLVSFAFDLDVSYTVMLLAVGTVNLAGLIPASPGQIGVFEFFVVAVLVGAGIAEVEAASYALVVHVVIWLPVTLAGFAFLVRQGLGWRAITRAQQLEEQAEETSTPSYQPADVNEIYTP